MNNLLSSTLNHLKRIKAQRDPRVRSMCAEHERELDWHLTAFAMSTEDLTRLREARLSQTIVHARNHSPFYQQLLRSLPDDPFEAFSQMPITSKVDIIRSEFPRQTKARPGERRLTGKTSGSSGEPFLFEIDDLLPTRHSAQRAFIYMRAGVSKGSTILEIVPGDRRERSPALEVSRFKRFRIGYAQQDLFSAVDELRPELLYGNRSHLLQVAEECEKRGLRVDIPLVCSSSETVLADDIERLKRAFGCQFFEVYGSAEASNIAYYLPGDALWTILEPRIWVEVINEHGKHASEGEAGELVVTTLTETTAPFLRYATGDLAVVGKGCGSGATGLGLASLEGRSSDVVISASSTRVSFWALATAKFWGRDDIAPYVKRWKIHQSLDKSICIFVEVNDCTRLVRLQRVIYDFVRSVVGDLPISVRVVDQVHDPKKGKFRAVTSDAK